jgi:sulfite dehydrogenase (quinone) subunit SoeC
MHPAYSVIFFTAASGAGYGLLALLALGGALGLVPPELGITVAGFGLALALITAGLLSSTAHLGRPERAWRAFSQWRTSWLSREGVLAVATYPVAGVVALGWLWGRPDAGLWAMAGLLTAILATATVIATGQIYASLTTIRDWHQPTTTPVYVMLALATGALLLNGLMIAFRHGSDEATWLTC